MNLTNVTDCRGGQHVPEIRPVFSDITLQEWKWKHDQWGFKNKLLVALQFLVSTLQLRVYEEKWIL